jgi:PAS domain S-box-containing protein
MDERLTLREIMNASANAVVATGASGNILFANKRAEEMFAFDSREVVGSSISDVLPMVAPLVLRSLKTGKPHLGQRVQGDKLSLVANITFVHGKGEVKGAICSFQAAAQLELTAQNLESYISLNRQLNAIFESSSDGIWVCDSEGKVIRVNRASEKLNGIKARDVIGKNVSDLLLAGLFDRSVTLDILATKRQTSIVQYVKRTDKHLLTTGTPAFDDQDNIYLVVVNERDMTQLNAIRDQLEQSRMVTERIKDELVKLSMLELEKQEIVAESSVMIEVLQIALRLAQFDASNILILGESGTGKGLLAKFIHKSGKRSKKPFIQINCAALPENLLEAELFGYDKGAFTGARQEGKVGLIELAQEGTLFLDEIGDLPLAVQAKLLKYLDDHEVMRLGGTKPRKVDCTIIAATNRDPGALTRNGGFRQDLFFRLNTFTIHIPPLRERREDIIPFVNLFLNRYNKAYGQNKHLSPKGLEKLQSRPFPGNVRELENFLKNAVLMSGGESLDGFIIRTSPEKPVLSTPGWDSRQGMHDELHVLEREIFRKAVKHCGSTRQIARHLGVSQATVVRKLKKHGLNSGALH